MRVTWIIADDFVDPIITPETLKNLGPTWGGWRTWRSWSTDNVLCHDFKKCTDFVKRAFQAVCNLYIPNSFYVDLNRPVGVKLYEGEFPDSFEHPEEVISMHLVTGSSDLVLLLGFDLTPPTTEDKLIKHRRLNYLNAFQAVIKQYPDIQWVLIDSKFTEDKKIEQPNLTYDTFDNVIKLLS